MLSSAILAAALSTSSAAAKDKPISDHTQAVTVVATAIFEPRLELDYDKSLSDKTSYTAGVTVGRYNNLLLRFVNAVSEDNFVINQVGAYGGYNYHFKHFNRGWYASGIARYDHIGATFGEEPAGSYSRVAVGPALGWKVATEGGFTFKWDLGVGYGAYLGYDAGSSSASMGEPKNGVVGLGSLNMGMSF